MDYKIQKYFCFIITLIFVNFSTVAQQISSIGDSLRFEGNTADAFKVYYANYQQYPNDSINLYNYSCLLAIDGQIDSAYKYLNLALNIYKCPPIEVLSDPDLLNLIEDKRWANISDNILSEYYKNVDKKVWKKSLIKKLLLLKAQDQAYYTEIEIAEKKIGKNATVVKALWKLKEYQNKLNVVELNKILLEIGWPRISIVGRSASSVAFLIIQHSNIKLQKKYLPLIRRLYKISEVDVQDYVLIYDRVQIGMHKSQLYGSQVKYNSSSKKYELYPIQNEKNVDHLRRKMGLEPLVDYLKNWNIDYSPIN